MKLELVDPDGCAILMEASGPDRLHITTDLMGGDGVRLDRDQVAELAAALDLWLKRIE